MFSRRSMFKSLAAMAAIPFVARIPEAVAEAVVEAPKFVRPPGTVCGQIIMSVSAEPPVGLIPCDGREIDRTAFKELYDLMKGRLPDLRYRPSLHTHSHYISGPGDRAISVDQWGRPAEYTLTTAEIPSHTHSISDARTPYSWPIHYFVVP